MREYLIIDAINEFNYIRFGNAYTQLREAPSYLTWRSIRQLIDNRIQKEIEKDKKEKMKILLSKCPFRKNPY